MDIDHEKSKLINALVADGIRDPRVLAVIAEVPRELFVDEALRDRAWQNVALPIDRGQTISQPYVVAFMTEVAEVTDRHRVLEIGTGSGYQAAILSKLCRRVYTIERHQHLYEMAQQRFRKLDFGKITAKLGDGRLGWPEQAPFDRILVTAAAPEVPEALIEQLTPGGMLVAPVGHDLFGQELVRITKGTNGNAVEGLLPVRFVPLLSGIEKRD